MVEAVQQPVTHSPRALAKKICDRKYGIGADGLLLLERSKRADIRMRIFNADGSEAEMCGNGARCVALYVSLQGLAQASRKKIKIETKAGIIDAEVHSDTVKIKLTDPKLARFDIPLKVGGCYIRVNFIDTGVPHTVVFAEGLDKIDVKQLGPLLRYHTAFAPRGTNVDFIEVLSGDAIKIRTYERGVEDETLACGTGSVAAALVFARKAGVDKTIHVHTRSGEILTVYFTRRNRRFRDVWLRGKARMVFKGEIV